MDAPRYLFVGVLMRFFSWAAPAWRVTLAKKKQRKSYSTDGQYYERKGRKGELLQHLVVAGRVVVV